MRDLRRNKRKIHYAKYLGKQELRDENGYLTGEIEEMWSDPIELSINVSMNSGNVEYNAFGTVLAYDRELVTVDVKCPINEKSLIWFEADINEPANYVVVDKFTTPRQVTYAIRRVV